MTLIRGQKKNKKQHNSRIKSFHPRILAFLVKNKESACNAGDMGLIPGLERCPGEGNGNLLQYFCLGNPMGRGAWWATVHGSQESDTT